eukprot:scaffold7308_cov114-Isochrysis_galbana.AAC.5
MAMQHTPASLTYSLSCLLLITHYNAESQIAKNKEERSSLCVTPQPFFLALGAPNSNFHARGKKKTMPHPSCATPTKQSQ